MIWYRKAAAFANLTVVYSIATMYRLGQGVVKDQAEAEHWCQRAAERGLVQGERAAFWRKMRTLDGGTP